MLGERLIIENIAGAEDTTGSLRAMRANADDYTILKVITFCRHQAGLNTDVPFALHSWPFGLLLWIKTGDALIEQKISAWPPRSDVCALMSTRPSGST
jgi:hypothetical protein